MSPKPENERNCKAGHPPAAHPKLHGAMVGEGRGGLDFGVFGSRASMVCVGRRYRGNSCPCIE